MQFKQGSNRHQTYFTTPDLQLKKEEPLVVLADKGLMEPPILLAIRASTLFSFDIAGTRSFFSPFSFFSFSF
jgi:hypothetical protein